MKIYLLFSLLVISYRPFAQTLTIPDSTISSKELNHYYQLPETNWNKIVNSRFFDNFHTLAVLGYLPSEKIGKSMLEYIENGDSDLGSEVALLAAKKFLKSRKVKNKEAEAIKYYTGHGYAQVNPCLRSDNCGKAELKQIKKIKSYINKLSFDQKQFSFRGTNLPDFVVKNIKRSMETKSALVLDKAFMSSSMLMSKGLSFIDYRDHEPTLIVYFSSQGAPIALHAEYYRELEVLLIPGIKFQVAYFEKGQDFCLQRGLKLKKFSIYPKEQLKPFQILVLLEEDFPITSIEFSTEFIQRVCQMDTVNP